MIDIKECLKLKLEWECSTELIIHDLIMKKIS